NILIHAIAAGGLTGVALSPHRYVAVYEECVTFSEAAGETDVAVLRYYSEGSFADLLERGTLAPDDMTDILRQILDGLIFLHANGVVHRDLKPSNILMARRPDGRYIPKIADFGISKQCGGVDDTAIAAVSVGYASPEQLCGQPQGFGSDLWSYGVIVYRAIAGSLPFESGSLDPNSMMGRVEIMNKITSGQLPDALVRLPQPWQSVVKGCLVVDPCSRADEKTLSDLIGCPAEGEWIQSLHRPVSAPVRESAPVQQASPAERTGSNTMRWVIVALLVALLGGLVVLLMIQQGRRPVATPMATPVYRPSAPESPSVSTAPERVDTAYAVETEDEEYANSIEDSGVVYADVVDTVGAEPVDTAANYDNSFFD
ncbi:MAG: serine/threonine protein kinase, partial [Paramuribaculum sp.]|nr:serine/threonine protein kinase [Paramuribaculum sp.]